MATYKSDLIAAKDSLAVSEKSAFNSDRTNATVLQATAVYTLKGTENNGDFIELVDLPAGAILIPHLSYVADSKPTALTGGQANIRIGVQGDLRFGYVANLTPMSSQNFGNEVQYEPVPLAETTRIVAEIGNLSTFPEGGKLAFGISYAIKG